jgi:cation transporter-like permease
MNGSAMLGWGIILIVWALGTGLAVWLETRNYQRSVFVGLAWVLLIQLVVVVLFGTVFTAFWLIMLGK